MGKLSEQKQWRRENMDKTRSGSGWSDDENCHLQMLLSHSSKFGHHDSVEAISPCRLFVSGVAFAERARLPLQTTEPDSLSTSTIAHHIRHCTESNRSRGQALHHTTEKQAGSENQSQYSLLLQQWQAIGDHTRKGLTIQLL